MLLQRLTLFTEQMCDCAVLVPEFSGQNALGQVLDDWDVFGKRSAATFSFPGWGLIGMLALLETQITTQQKGRSRFRLCREFA